MVVVCDDGKQVSVTPITNEQGRGAPRESATKDDNNITQDELEKMEREGDSFLYESHVKQAEDDTAELKTSAIETGVSPLRSGNGIICFVGKLSNCGIGECFRDCSKMERPR